MILNVPPEALAAQEKTSHAVYKAGICALDKRI